MTRRLAIALVHWPVLDKIGATVTSAVTNMDIHDLSRSARTFGASPYYVVTPIAAQRTLVETIVGHWTHGSSGNRIPSRREALSEVVVVKSIDDAVAHLGGRETVEIWTTAASRPAPGEPSRHLFPNYQSARDQLASGDPRSVLLLFGTSWGLTKAALQQADAQLPPIDGCGSAFNHLSVRAAAAITLDRLIGTRA